MLNGRCEGETVISPHTRRFPDPNIKEMSEKPAHNPETVLPYDSDESKEVQVQRMFDAIAPVYDRMNRLMTFGLDRGWRRKALKMLRRHHPRRILDVATGTGDLPFMMCRMLDAPEVTGIDLSEGMLAIAREKCRELQLHNSVRFEKQDCLSLTFPDGSFDAVTVAFGVRNFKQLRQGFSEMYRVLKPGGILLVIELSTPTRFPFAPLYRFYAGRVIPLLGRMFTRDKQAYTYLPRSVEAVPQGEEMLSIFRSVGFGEVFYRPLTWGVCTIYVGKR